MERKETITSANVAEQTAADTGNRVVPPLFDEKAVRQARPALPLARFLRWRLTWPLAVALMVAVAGLIGGVIGGVVTSLYQGEPLVQTSAPEQRAQIASMSVVNRSSEQPAAPPLAAADTNTTARAAQSELSDKSSQVERDGETNKKEANKKSDEQSASARASESSRRRVEPESRASDESEPVKAGEAHDSLRGALGDWVAATNARDVDRQMNFYDQKMNAFYLTRNVTRSAVRAEKARVFGKADAIDVQAGAPEIKLSPDGRTATMRFRKRYSIEGGEGTRRGEVLQELRWRREGNKWKIVSERDLRVID